MQLEPIHISFTGGTRGEFLAAAVFTAQFARMPSYKISPEGKMRIRGEPLITKEHKSVNGIDDIIDHPEFWKIPKKRFVDTVTKKSCPIGLSHYAPELHQYEQSFFIKDCFLIKLLQSSPVIIIDHEESDIPSIALQSANKNRHKSYEELLQCKETKWLDVCKKYFTNFEYVQFKDITNNLPKVIETISKHTGVTLRYNQYTEQILQEYISLNEKYKVELRAGFEPA